MISTYFHHFLAILGSIAGIYGGGYMAVTASVSLITEFSTPFVNIRSILYDLKETSGTIYIINGLMMTISFFLCRCIFQAWFVYVKLLPAVYSPNKIASNFELFSFYSYLVLVVLNFYWFSKMLTGCIKVLKKSNTEKNKRKE